MAQAARCSARAPLIALSGVTLAAAAASATLSIEAAALALGSLSGTGRSLLGVRTADRPVGCDARRRSCIGYAFDQAARRVSLQRPTCDARRRSCVSNALDRSCCYRSRKLKWHRPLVARRAHR
jgi:hypothetical protein